jgi:hypothetical protein
MLTDNQLKLIDDLKMEFCKMNMPIGRSSGGLINKAEIDHRFSESDKRRAQLQAITDATNKAIMEMMDMDMERLNHDLIPMGMVVTRSKHNMFYANISVIGKLSTNRFDVDMNKNFISFKYLLNNKYEGQIDGKGMTYYTGFHSITFDDYRFNSIDEMCKNERFIKKIEDEYYVLKTKNK